MLDMEQKILAFEIDDETGGIVDGAHTAEIIKESNAEGMTPTQQYVEVYIKTGVEEELI